MKPLAKIVSWATCGVDPSLMGSGPIPASKKALKKAGWQISDLDLLKFGQWLYKNSETKINENENITGKKYRIKIFHPPDFQNCTWENSNECNQYLIAFYYRDLDIHNQGVVKLYNYNGDTKEYSQPILDSDIDKSK